MGGGLRPPQWRGGEPQAALERCRESPPAPIPSTRTRPVSSQPIDSQPIDSQPTASQPIASQPIAL
eukprot:1196064-Prorocentrum_minimum.AAC.7